MLRFQNWPDKVLQAIIQACLDYTREQLYPYLPDSTPTEEDLKEQDEFYQDMYPMSPKLFSRAEALAVIDRLLIAHTDNTKLYQLTDYHWLLLYESLDLYCELYNDGALVKGYRARPYRIGRIDFDEVVSHFFWDTDFLFEADDLLTMGLAGRSAMVMSDETFGVVTGLKPHPSEIEMTPVAWGTEDRLPFQPLGPKGYRLRAYPPRQSASWYDHEHEPKGDKDGYTPESATQ
jgi:hypothetical protein